MKPNLQPRVGLLALTLELYETLAPGLRASREAWLQRDLLAALRPHADVRFTGRVSDDELLGLYATSSVVIFPPADEDYGYIALEAFLSRKPVVTCTDSGGPLEFVVDGENGRVVAPDAALLGAAVADLLADSEKAKRFGERGFERVREIRWDSAVKALLEAGGIR